MSAPPVSPSVSSPSGRVKRHSGYFEQPIKAPNLPSFSDSLPAPQFGQSRGSAPDPFSGKKWRPSSASSASSPAVVVNAFVPSIAVGKARQNSRGNDSQSTRPPER